MPHPPGSSTGNKMSLSTHADDTSFNSDPNYSVGHCAFGLEQLCKTALVSSGGLCASVNIARLLLKDGFPMTRLDPQSEVRLLIIIFPCQNFLLY